MTHDIYKLDKGRIIAALIAQGWGMCFIWLGYYLISEGVPTWLSLYLRYISFLAGFFTIVFGLFIPFSRGWIESICELLASRVDHDGVCTIANYIKEKVDPKNGYEIPVNVCIWFLGITDVICLILYVFVTGGFSHSIYSPFFPTIPVVATMLFKGQDKKYLIFLYLFVGIGMFITSFLKFPQNHAYLTSTNDNYNLSLFLVSLACFIVTIVQTLYWKGKTNI